VQASFDLFLEQIARRGSWLGGGSAAAVTAALAAALVEKLTVDAGVRRQVRRLRRDCTRLVQQDAAAFARVIRASRSGRREAFVRALQAATDVPCQIVEQASAVETACRRTARTIKPQFQSDLRCARALAAAAGASGRALIDTNLKWLNDPAFSRGIRRRLRNATRRPAR